MYCTILADTFRLELAIFIVNIMNEKGVNFIDTIIRINIKYKEQELSTQYNDSWIVMLDPERQM